MEQLDFFGFTVDEVLGYARSLNEQLGKDRRAAFREIGQLKEDVKRLTGDCSVLVEAIQELKQNFLCRVEC